MEKKTMLMVVLLGYIVAGKAQTVNTSDSLTMEKMMQSLPEVMVKGRTPVVKAERGMLSYNMPQLLKQLPADNAYEALTHIPGISDADGGMKLAGNDITLIINGQTTTLTQEQLTDRLKSMPASQLAKAEVMLAAPARLHVRGMAINIVTKDYAGTNQLSGQVNGGLQQDKYAKGFADAYLSWQRDKFGLDAQYSFIDGNRYGDVSRMANHPLQGQRVAYEDYTWQKGLNLTHDYRLGLSYAFAKNHRMEVAYTGKWEKNCTTNHTTGSSTSSTHFDSHVYLHNVDLNYTLPFGLTLSGSYTHYRTPQQQTLNGTLVSADTERDFISVSKQTINKWAFAADQNHALQHGWGLNYGVKAQFTNNDNSQLTLDNNGLALDNATSSVSIYERIWNIYGGFSKDFGKGISLEMSLATEQYHSSLWNEWRLYPSFSFLWQVNENHVLNLSFSSNSEYPSYWSTMGARHYASIYSEIWGNPSLKPYSHYNINLMWQIKQRYTLMAFASVKPDYFVQLPYQTTERMAVIMQETNFNFNRSYGLRALAMFNSGKWLSGSAYAVGMLKHDKSDNFFDLPFDRKRFTAILGGTASVKLLAKHDLRLILNPFYQSKAIQGVYDIQPVFTMDAVLRWTSADGRWGVRINGQNIFNNRFDTRSVQGNQDYRMKLAKNWPTYTFALIYKFGGYKEKSVKEVDTSRMGH